MLKLVVFNLRGFKGLKWSVTIANTEVNRVLLYSYKSDWSLIIRSNGFFVLVMIFKE